MKSDRQLQLLICSANLGNAEIDETSLHHWVPEDGNCLEVLQNKARYPVRTNAAAEHDNGVQNNKEYSLDIQNDCADYNEYDQFDIIVFGLQESTFDPPKDDNQKDDTSNAGSRLLVPLPHELVNKTVNKAASTVNKAASAIQTLTANKDHNTKKHLRHQSSSGIGGSEHTASMLDSKHQQQLQSPQKQQWHGGTPVLHGMLAKRLPSYHRAVSFQRGEMRLIILVHNSLMVHYNEEEEEIDAAVQVVHVSAQNTGRAGLANKGGIVAELLVLGNTRLSFFTAHLEAHEGPDKCRQRVSTVADIFAGTKEKMHDCSLTAHYSFAMGDLNFRTELPNYKEIGEDEHKRLIRDMVAQEDWAALNEADELNRVLQNKECFVGYKTLFCNFPPTFKVERKPGYHYIDKRRPSYTDRILYKANHELADNISPLIYEPIDDFASSDHKPIRGVFTVQLNEPLLFRPKMSRRRSVMNLGGILSKKKLKEVVAHKERFHLFVSDISCSIHSDGSKAKSLPTMSLPNPYICLISDPPEALQHSVDNRWRRIQQQMAKTLLRRSEVTKFVTSKGWPRSSIHKQTYMADWQEEEIHAEVQTHRTDGSPIDLTGATLRVTLTDNRAGAEDVVIGTFCFNLVNLLRSCRPSTEASSRTILKNRGKKKPHMSGRPEFRQTGRRNSLLNVFRKSEVEEPADELDYDPISSVEIDEPLLKNGVERGWIRCKIEAWWMDEATAKALGTSGMFAAFVNSNKNSTSLTSTTANGAAYGTTADGRQMMLSPRRNREGRRNKRGSAETT